MDYKTILVHATGSRNGDALVTFAAQLALRHGAHLIGAVQTGAERFVRGTPPEGYMRDLTPLIDDLRRQAEQRANSFDALARQAGLASFEYRIDDDDDAYALARRAMYADLVIVGQSDPNDPARAGAAIPEHVALHAPAPVLVLPHEGPHAGPHHGHYAPVFERILVAWNASPEASRAVRLAMPLLERARKVEVATVCRDAGEDAALGGPDIALVLARQGVKAAQWQECRGIDADTALRTRTGEYRPDLVVMGCYGRSRFRELLLGGVSRAMLRTMAAPVLMAH